MDGVAVDGRFAVRTGTPPPHCDRCRPNGSAATACDDDERDDGRVAATGWISPRRTAAANASSGDCDAIDDGPDAAANRSACPASGCGRQVDPAGSCPNGFGCVKTRVATFVATFVATAAGGWDGIACGRSNDGDAVGCDAIGCGVATVATANGFSAAGLAFGSAPLCPAASVDVTVTPRPGTVSPPRFGIASSADESAKNSGDSAVAIVPSVSGKNSGDSAASASDATSDAASSVPASATVSSAGSPNATSAGSDSAGAASGSAAFGSAATRPVGPAAVSNPSFAIASKKSANGLSSLVDGAAAATDSVKSATPAPASSAVSRTAWIVSVDRVAVSLAASATTSSAAAASASPVAAAVSSNPAIASAKAFRVAASS